MLCVHFNFPTIREDPSKPQLYHAIGSYGYDIVKKGGREEFKSPNDACEIFDDIALNWRIIGLLYEYVYVNEKSVFGTPSFS